MTLQPSGQTKTEDAFDNWRNIIWQRNPKGYNLWEYKNYATRAGQHAWRSLANAWMSSVDSDPNKKKSGIFKFEGPGKGFLNMADEAMGFARPIVNMMTGKRDNNRWYQDEVMQEPQSWGPELPDNRPHHDSKRKNDNQNRIDKYFSYTKRRRVDLANRRLTFKLAKLRRWKRKKDYWKRKLYY